MSYRNILVLSILFFSCRSSNRNATFIPREFFLPDNEIGKGKIFVYVDQLSGDTSYSEYYHRNLGQNEFLIHRAYGSEGTNDSLIYLDHKLMETYSFRSANGSLVKGEILEDTIIATGKRLGKNILKVRFPLDSALWTINSESEYLKDTTFSWSNMSIPTIVIKTSYNTIVKSKSTDEGQLKFNLEFLTYEAKNIGSVRIKILTPRDGRVKDIDLKQIREL